MRSFLVAVGVLVACGGPRSAPPVLAGSGGRPDAGAPPAVDSGTPNAGSLDDGVTDAGSANAGAPDAGPFDAGAPDAGTLDGGSSDAGDDAGTADAGADAGRAATIDCAPFGAARLAWTLTGYQSPWRPDDANWYTPLATDTLDGVVVRHGTESGHFSGSSDATYGPDGGLRAAGLAYYSCHPVQGCFESSEVISNGTIYESGGMVLSAQDGHVLYQFDPAPAGADAGAYWVQKGVAANSGIGVFRWSNYQAPTSTVTALDSDGGTVWQSTFPKGVESAAVDDTGVTLLRMYAGDLVAIAPDGEKLYSLTPDMNLHDLQAAGGRFYLGGGTVYNVADGSPLLTLTMHLSQTPLLTASRMYLSEYDASTERLRMIAVDPATGNTVWEQALGKVPSWQLTYVPFSVTGERAVIVDTQHVLRVLNADDGTELLVCKVAPDVGNPVLLSGGRLAVRRHPNLEVYDLPY